MSKSWLGRVTFGCATSGEGLERWNVAQLMLLHGGNLIPLPATLLGGLLAMGVLAWTGMASAAQAT